MSQSAARPANSGDPGVRRSPSRPCAPTPAGGSSPCAPHRPARSARAAPAVAELQLAGQIRARRFAVGELPPFGQVRVHRSHCPRVGASAGQVRAPFPLSGSSLLRPPQDSFSDVWARFASASHGWAVLWSPDLDAELAFVPRVVFWIRRCALALFPCATAPLEAASRP